MVTFNSSNTTAPSWSFSNNSIPYIMGAATEFVRYGSQGILVAIGGAEAEPLHAMPYTYRSMANVQVYDVASQTWFEIIATGDIPPGRMGPCSGIAAAPDDSSFQMVVYGGSINPQNLSANADDTYPGEVYVLVMPAFVWIKTNASFASGVVANGTAFNTSSGRSPGYCNTYNDRSFLVVGGDQMTHSNAVVPPLKLLDTSTYQWQTKYPLPNTTYFVPQPVVSVVGGGPQGGANPASTWQYTLGASVSIFSKTIPIDKASGAAAAASAGVSAKAPNPYDCGDVCPGTPPTHYPIAGLIGTIVGAVVGSMFVILGVYCLLVLHRRSRSSDSDETSDVASDTASKSEIVPWDRTPATSQRLSRHPQHQDQQREYYGPGPKHFWTPSWRFSSPLFAVESSGKSRRTSTAASLPELGLHSARSTQWWKKKRSLHGGELPAGDIAIEAPESDYHTFIAELASPTGNGRGSKRFGSSPRTNSYKGGFWPTPK